MQEKSIYLYFKDETSDKVYYLRLMKDPDGSDGWRVRYQNGKRGKALTVGDFKTSVLPYDAANAEFEKIVSAQKRKGYTESETGVAYQGEAIGKSFSGIRVQLLKPVSTDAVMDLMHDPDYLWQEKMDGERRPLQKRSDGTVIGTQRDGLIVPIPTVLEQAVNSLPIDYCTIDGEDLGEGRYAAFDLISTPTDPEGKRPYKERYAELLCLLKASPSPCWIAIPTAYSPEDAHILLQQIAGRNGEGLVGKKATAPYRPGESLDQVKFPFFDRVTAFVIRPAEVKRSVEAAVLGEDGSVVSLGYVGVPKNVPLPEVGSIIDIQYLYAHRGSSKLHEPVYKGIRGDRQKEHCGISQLKYKPNDLFQLIHEDDAEDANETPSV